MTDHPKIFVTAASGQLGGLVVDALLETVPATFVIAGTRDLSGEAAIALRERGVEVRVADYTRPDTLATAFAGVDHLLLISGSDVGQRTVQHRNVINAAKTAGVKLIAYTSILHADTSPLLLAEDYRDTEAALREAGVPLVLLRNGLYTEVYTWGLPAALQQGVLLGAAEGGRISTAARSDYARAAATVLSGGDHAGQVYELAGDQAFTLAELARIVSDAAGKLVAYQNVPPEDLNARLLAGGSPEPVAKVLSDTDAGAARGALFDDGGALSRLIGRPTTPFQDTITSFVRGLGPRADAASA